MVAILCTQANILLVFQIVYAIQPAFGNIAVGLLREVSIPKQVCRRVLAHRGAGHTAAGAYVEVVLPTSTAATPKNILYKSYSCRNHCLLGRIVSS
jgi:hypothetical protein